ncbi:hypothetical protein GJAV_G00015930 [Gymnothorax javanicus]|nr:hypothetical protein GJAV_G00015930 [Gymnothorax javanicus]
MYFGNTCQNAILPALVRPPLPTVQPSLDMKQFFPFPLDSTTTLSLFPNFSTNVVGISRTEQSSPIGSWKTGLSSRRLCNSMDPVQKAIINHTFGVPSSLKRKHVVSCSVCQLKFNSQSQASAHYRGTKHAKRLKALEAPKCKQKLAALTKETSNKDTPRRTFPPLIPTSTGGTDNVAAAGILLPSPPLQGTMLTAPSVVTEGDNKDISTKGIKEVPSCAAAAQPAPCPSPSHSSETEAETEDEKAKRLLYCSLCKVAVNSASQLEAHNSGTKHKTMMEARSGSGTIKSFPQARGQGKISPADEVCHGFAEQNLSL